MKLSRRGVIQGAAAMGSLWAMGCASSSKAGSGATDSAAQGSRLPPPGKPRNILILGGTQFLGPALVEFARSRGHTLTLFNRGKTNPGLFPDVEKLQGDRDPNKGEGLKALEGRKWDAVVDTSGYVPRVVKASAELLAPHVGSEEQGLRACGSACLEHFFYSSTVGRALAKIMGKRDPARAFSNTNITYATLVNYGTHVCEATGPRQLRLVFRGDMQPVAFHEGTLAAALAVTGAVGTVKSTAHSLDHSEYLISWE